MGADLNFHSHILRMAWKRRRRLPHARFMGFLSLLLWWEAVNAAGFLRDLRVVSPHGTMKQAVH
jgi:hypothetical protein